MEYLKAKINELKTNSKNKNMYRGISDFKKGYQPRPNVVKDEKGDLVVRLTKQNIVESHPMLLLNNVYSLCTNIIT
jgi:hypothetical protein